MSVELFLAVIGLIIATGFFSGFIFDKARIPDVLLLLGCGVLIGRWLGPDTQQLARAFAPYFGAIAIIMILFEGGLTLDVKALSAHFKNAFLLALATFTFSLIIIAYAAVSWLGWRLLPSLMFGAIIGCSSSAIIIPTLQRSRAPEEIKALATMESLLSDTLAIIVLMVLVDIELGAEIGPGAPLGHFVRTLVISFGIALPVGLFWLNVLDWTKARQLSYLWTFAILVLVYAYVDWLHGNGAIAVFFVALLIGNNRYLPWWLHTRKIVRSEEWELVESVTYDTLRWFHTELTFLVRSFFFVYIGLLFHTSYVKGGHFWMMVGFTAAIALTRCLGIWIIQRGPRPLSRPLLWAFLPRGLVSAVLATIPVSRGIPGTEQFLEYAVPVILSTNIIMAVWVFVWERQHGCFQAHDAPACGATSVP